jgi:hypothetical protein
LARRHHLVTAVAGSEILTPLQFVDLLRVRVTAPENWRVGALMLERRCDRPAAREALAEQEREHRDLRREWFGRQTPRSGEDDLVVNAATLGVDAIVAAIEATARARRFDEAELLSAAAEAQIQFRVRVDLSRHGMSPPDRPELKRPSFVHPSEEMFARLLDFYRIAWEYEPKSFPIQWDREGKVS